MLLTTGMSEAATAPMCIIYLFHHHQLGLFHLLYDELCDAVTMSNDLFR